MTSGTDRHTHIHTHTHMHAHMPMHKQKQFQETRHTPGLTQRLIFKHSENHEGV